MVKALRGFFASFKDRFIRHRITVINAAVTVVLIGTIAVVLLWRASDLQRRTAEESIVNQIGMVASEIQAQYNIYFDIVRTVSQIMRNYETVNIDQRRVLFNDTMLGVLASNRSLVSIYTIWQPDVLDGRDAQYANTEGSDETGQYISGYTREQGWLEFRSFRENKYLLDMGADRLSNEMITNPTYRSLAGRDAFVVDVRVPIMRSNTFDIVGIVGITISMEELQILTDSIKPYGTGRVILCSSDGTIAVHYDLALRGQYIVASNFQRVVPFTSPEDSGPGINLIFDSLFTQKYTVLKTGEVMVVAYPCTLGAVGSPWVVITSVPLSVIMSPLNNLIRFSVIFIFAAGALAALVMYITSRSLTQRAEEMQRGLERATAMQDNLKYGLCLLDHDLVIQEAYSKALERVLTISELQGKNFIELLSSSLKTNEIEGLKDYFNMIFNRAFDQKMLEDINPINEFSYISTETGDAKTLRSSFSLTEWGQNATFIMATLEDITAERELAKQLAEAGNIREQEMNSLFQVIQLNPRVLTDFIEDTEHEFEQINKTLQDRSIPPRNVLREIYQSIHAIKSDALILSLEHFANGLHKLESTIKALQEKEDIPFDDILGIIFELEAVLKEKDKLKEAITKIENFRSHAGQGANQETYILTETLHKVCEKAQAKLDKKVRLVQEQIDDSVLTHGPRRIIKEILVQLIRNAVYHGIETVIGRQKAGKDPMGEIRLAIWYMDDKAHLKLEDDGGGIDYEKVLRSARKQNLIKNPLDAASKDYLLQLLFSPGFSTAEKTDMTAGRGIGLSLVRDRVKELKGSIKIRTEPGKGTTFVISFPLNLPDGQEELTPLI